MFTLITITIGPLNDIIVKIYLLRCCFINEHCARVSETMPLYDILNEFQKGLSHMAIVIKQHGNAAEQPISKRHIGGKHI